MIFILVLKASIQVTPPSRLPFRQESTTDTAAKAMKTACITG